MIGSCTGHTCEYLSSICEEIYRCYHMHEHILQGDEPPFTFNAYLVVFRSGSAITLALSGSQLADVMSHVGWSNKDTALYYMKLAEVLCEGSPSDLLSSSDLAVSNSTNLYADRNRLKDFVRSVLLGWVFSLGFSLWGWAFFLCRFCGLLLSILGLSSTRDCWCPYSAIGVRETDENRQLFSAVSPRTYKRESKQRNDAILSKLLSSLDLTCHLLFFVSFYTCPSRGLVSVAFPTLPTLVFY